MKCPAERDLNNHLSKVDDDEFRESLIDEMADHVLEDYTRFDELFSEESVSIASIKYIHSLMTGKHYKETVHDWREFVREVKRQARISAIKIINEGE